MVEYAWDYNGAANAEAGLTFDSIQGLILQHKHLPKQFDNTRNSGPTANLNAVKSDRKEMQLLIYTKYRYNMLE